MSNFNRRLSVFNEMDLVEEAYFGRTKNLKELERQCTKLLDLFHSNYNRKTIGDEFDIDRWHKAVESIMSSKDGGKLCIQNMEKAIQKEFGFNEVNIILNRELTILGPNAFAVGVCGCIRKITSVGHLVPLSQGDGKYYDKKQAFVCTICLVTSLFDVKDLTGPELTGMILHELGHIFQCTPMTNLGVFLPIAELYSQTIKSVKGLPAILNMIPMEIFYEFSPEIFNVVGKAINAIHDSLGNDVNKAINSVLKMGESILLHLSNVVPFLKTGQLISGTATKLATNPATTLAQLVTGYSGEIFADSFATAYGYGPELSSALAKLQTTVDIDYNLFLSQDNPFKPIYELSLVTYEIATSIISLDAHPSTQKRIINQLNKLEREASSADLPPKLKQSVLADIKRQRQAYNEYLNAGTKENKLAILSMYRNMNDAIGGKLEWKGIVNYILNLGHDEA